LVTAEPALSVSAEDSLALARQRAARRSQQKPLERRAANGGPLAPRRSKHTDERRGLLPLKPKFGSPQARSVVSHDALDILGETVGGLGVDVEGQRDRRAADAVQLAQD
jgi:hypothetical protein